MKNTDLNYVVSVYKRQVAQGDLQTAYSALVKYVQKFKTTCSKALGDDYSVGNVFQGYMDYTYFYISNNYLKERKLKLALVFNHTHIRFEVWLLGQTKDVQEKYWELLKNTKWINGSDIPTYSIFETTLIGNPDFNNLDALSEILGKHLNQCMSDIVKTLKKIV